MRLSIHFAAGLCVLLVMFLPAAGMAAYAPQSSVPGTDYAQETESRDMLPEGAVRIAQHWRQLPGDRLCVGNTQGAFCCTATGIRADPVTDCAHSPNIHRPAPPPAPPRPGRGDPGGICTNAAMGAAVSQDVIRMCENLGWRF